MPTSASSASFWIFAVWARIRDFAGAGTGVTYVWPRWLVLRAVGLVYLVVFAGILEEAPALIGPEGIVPVDGFLRHVEATHGGSLAAFFRTPSLFWFGRGDSAITLSGWFGCFAAVALVLNVWPRMALVFCWGTFLSFVSVFHVFSPTQMDGLMLETALLLVPYAPRGLRPGLGVQSPPSPVALFMVRWLLFRVMAESGVVKLLSGEPRWRDFTAMEVMYETAPFPTVLGYFDHHLPHAYHLFETSLTFFAELAAPLLAVFAGQRGRWIAILSWLAFQAGIQATANFGWLNTAAAALGLLLLDDQMLGQAAKRLRLDRLRAWLSASSATPAATPSKTHWRQSCVHLGLWIHFGLTLYAFAISLSAPTTDFSYDNARPLRFAFLDFKSANAYTLYETFLERRLTVEFAGSHDAGRTWRTYPYRHLPQDEGRVSGFIAPRFLRFEATVQINGSTGEEKPILSLIAASLLAGNPRVVGLFAANPFPDGPPTLIRMRLYQLTFTDLATWRATGRYWHKTMLGDYAPLLYVGPKGNVERAVTVLDVERAKALAGNPEAQSHLGYIYATGRGGSKQPTEAVRWFRLAAAQGVAEAQYNLGVLLAESTGVAANLPEAVTWFRRAALQGHTAAQFELGVCLATGEGTRPDDVEALVWFELAAEAGHAEAQRNREVIRGRLPATALPVANERRREIETLLRGSPGSR